jgi:hypothetical protein
MIETKPDKVVIKVWPQQVPLDKSNTPPMSPQTTNNANKTAPANLKKTKLNPTVSNRMMWSGQSQRYGQGYKI